MKTIKSIKNSIWVVGILLFPNLLFSQQINEILGRPTDKSITINVLLPSQGDVYFEYGTSQGALSQTTLTYSSGTSLVVESDLTGLQAETRYYYRTKYKLAGQSSFATGDIHSFITQRKKGSSFVFTIEADPHPYDKKGVGGLFPICLQNQLNDNADFMIDMGDTFGDDHNPTTITSDQVKQLQLNCRGFFGKVCHSMPFFFCIGNHEGECGYYLNQTPPNNLATFETNWRKLYYPNPIPDGFYSGDTVDEGTLGKAENYYAWEWGDALFVVLDMYRYADASDKPQKWDFTIGKTQYDWFKKTLENSSAKYKFVFSHHVLGQGRGGIELANQFEWGGYDGSTYKFDTYRPGWGLPLHQLMKQNHVDAYFQGHDHIYVKQDLDGIVYQSVPMPSDTSYKIGITDNGDAYLSGTQLGGSGHLRVTVNSDSATVDFVKAVLPKDDNGPIKNGEVVFSYSIKKSTITSLNSNNKSSDFWTVYPNPAKESVVIETTELHKNSLVTIVDVSGQELIRRTITDAKTQIDISQLAGGIYFVKMVNDTKSEVKRLVKD